MGAKRKMTPAQQELVVTNLGLAGHVASKEAHRKANFGDAFPDMYQEACLGMCKASTTFDGSKSRFSTYGTYGAHFGVLGMFRRKQLPMTLGADLPENYLEESIADSDDDEWNDDVSSLIIYLRKAIARLPVRLRRIIQGRLECKTLAAIGAELGISKERVRQLQCKAMQQLRAEISRKLGI